MRRKRSHVTGRELFFLKGGWKIVSWHNRPADKYNLRPEMVGGWWRSHLSSSCEEKAAHAAGLAHTPGGDWRQDVLHCVIDGQPGCYTAARWVDIPSWQYSIQLQSYLTNWNKGGDYWTRIRIRMDSHSFDGHWLRNAGSLIRIQIRIKTERKEPEEISAWIIPIEVRRNHDWNSLQTWWYIWC